MSLDGQFNTELKGEVEISDKIIKLNSDNSSADTGIIFGSDSTLGALYYDGTMNIAKTTSTGDATTITDSEGCTLRCYSILPKDDNTSDLGSLSYQWRNLTCTGLIMNMNNITTASTSFGPTGGYLEKKSASNTHLNVADQNWYNSSVSLTAGVWWIKAIGYSESTGDDNWLNVGIHTSSTITLNASTRETWKRDMGSSIAGDLCTHFERIVAVSSTTTYYALVAKGSNTSATLYSNIIAHRIG